MSTLHAVQNAPTESTEVQIVDCDVHLVPKSRSTLLSYMPQDMRERLGPRRGNNSSGKEGYNAFGVSRRTDSYPADGGPAGSEPSLVYQQLFEDAAVDLALLVPEMRYTVDPKINAALAGAFNEWLSETWLGDWNLQNRFYGTISVSLDDPEGAVREIERWAGDRRFRQVLVSNYSLRPYGFDLYEPVWAAAEAHGLPIAMHNTAHGAGTIGLSPAGRFQRWVDFHSLAYPLMYSSHLVSWLCSGAFDRHPGLRIVLIEAGFLWHQPLMNRLAAEWPTLRHEVSAELDDPMEYVRRHVRFTTQPIEETEEPRDVATAMVAAEAERTLLLSSDYPHHDYDEPKRSLPPGLPKDLRRRVMSENAIELYGLPREY